MKAIDVVLSVLTLAAVGLGFAAYRAWHPAQVHAESPHAVNERDAEAIARRAHEAASVGNDPRRTLLEDWGVPKMLAGDKRMSLVEPPTDVRCYGETAVLIKGSAYTQAVGSDGRPLRCVAGKVLVPAR